MTIAPETQPSTAITAPSAMKQRTADVQAHGSQAPPAAETLRTTDEHPFLTTDRGFVSAEDLRVGEQIRQLDGGYGVVVALQHIFGVAVRYNLTVQDDHTYAVGADQWVVHNTDGCDGTLPNADKAQISSDKFSKYSMDPTNPNAERKASAFQALGYDVNSEDGRAAGAQDVIDQLKAGLADSPAEAGRATVYGNTMKTTTTIIGPNGMSGGLVAVWQFEGDENALG